MTVEQIELRKILTQMLADAGLNRETIKDFVREIVSEKVEKAVSDVFNQSNIGGLVNSKLEQYVRHGIDDAARSAVREQVKDYFSTISVTVNLNGHTHHRTSSP